MRFGSMCSGIEAASVAWNPLGWLPQFVAEIEPFPCAVLAQRYPDVPNLGDMTKFKEWPDAALDVLVAGTPCQSFSVAGLRKGLADPRGNLALTFLAIADRYRPRWLVWENVPGVLSSTSHAAADPCPPPDPVDMERDGQEVDVVDEYDSEELHAFNCFLAGLSELGYGWAYWVPDAQYFGVPQRRRRVFVVGYLGDWRRAAAVLFERHSLSGDSPPRRQAGQGTAHDVSPSIGASGRGFERAGETRGQDPVVAVAGTLGSNHGNIKAEHAWTGQLIPEVSPTLRAGGNRTGGDRPPGTDVDTCDSLIPVSYAPTISPALKQRDYKGPSSDGDGDGSPLIVTAFKASHFIRGKDGAPSDVAFPLSADADKGDQDTLICFDARQSDVIQYGNKTGPLDTDGHTHAIAFTQNTRDEVRMIGGDKAIVGALAAEPGMKQQNYVAFQSSQSGVRVDDVHATLDGNNGSRRHNGVVVPADPIAFESRFVRNGRGAPSDIVPPLKAQSGETGKGDAAPLLASASAVRRLTPRECERLQGFPDDYTAITVRGKPAADGPRYKALGNSMAVPVMRWIGERIQMVEALA